MNRTRARLSLAALVVTGAVTLSGCSILDQFAPASVPARDAATGEVTQQTDNADVFQVRVGDCLNTGALDASTEITDVPVVPCAEPHDDEVYHAFELADGEFPGEDAILAEADATCVAQFAEFIGLAYEQSTLDYWPMYPTEGSWENGDREVLCIAWDPAGEKVTGTLAGAAR